MNEECLLLGERLLVALPAREELPGLRTLAARSLEFLGDPRDE